MAKAASVKKNPFEDKNGSPKTGKEKEFYDWEIARAKRALKELPENERKAAIESEKALNKRMNS